DGFTRSVSDPLRSYYSQKRRNLKFTGPHDDVCHAYCVFYHSHGGDVYGDGRIVWYCSSPGLEIEEIGSGYRSQQTDEYHEKVWPGIGMGRYRILYQRTVEIQHLWGKR